MVALLGGRVVAFLLGAAVGYAVKDVVDELLDSGDLDEELEEEPGEETA